MYLKAPRFPARQPSWAIRSWPSLGAVFLSLTALAAAASARAVRLELKPRQSRIVTVNLASAQYALVHLHLEGGILGIRAIAPDGGNRPLWLIDLGRGGELSYVVAGSSAGASTVEITSFEREREMQVSLHTGDPHPMDKTAAQRLEAEDLLANAELLRRHWPGAPASQDARALYTRASALADGLGDVALKRMILTQEARYLAFGGHDYGAANALLEEAVGLPAAGDAPQQALSWKTLSSVRYQLGNYQPAIAAGKTAFSLYQQSGDVYWQGVVLGNLASVYAELGESAEAEGAGREALQDAEAQRDIAGVVYCLSQLANIYQQRGDFEKAESTFHQGLAWVSQIRYAPLVEAEIQKDLGSFYAQMGEWSLAQPPLARAIALEKEQNDPVSLEARGLLATVMQHQGRLAAALDEDTAAIAIAHQLKLKQDEASLLLKRAAVAIGLHRQQEALSDVTAAQALATLIQSVPLLVEAETTKGDASLETAPEAAEISYRRATFLAETAGEREQQAMGLAGQARALARQAKWTEAAIPIESALSIIEASRGGLSHRETQVTYFSQHRSWYELAVDICMTLHALHPNDGYGLKAFAYTERARARSLLDALESSGYPAEIPEAERLREDYAKIQRELAEGTAGLDSQKAAGQLLTLHREQERLGEQMLSADARLAALPGGHTAGVPEIQQQLLTGDAALLSYWVGESHSYRWLITQYGVSVQVLPERRRLLQAALPLEHMLQTRHPQPVGGEDIAGYVLRERSFDNQLQGQLARLGKLLLSGLPQRAHRLLVIGDGCLNNLPFAALRIAHGSGTEYALQRYSFLYQPSVSAAVYLKQHSAGRQALHITVFADPVLSPDDERVRAVVDRSAAADTSAATEVLRLRGSRQEAYSIAHDAPANTVTIKQGFSAAPGEVRKLSAEQAVILHFATHTVTMEGRPEAAGIALSSWNQAGEPQDGVFRLKDIYGLHLPSELVVLSGCSTNRRQSNDDGEALNNLAYAFFFAGAHAVTGSLWAVEDNATGQMMDHFYKNLLLRHQAADAALRAAQLSLLGNPQTRSPALWAAFAVEGWPEVYSASEQRSEAMVRKTGLLARRP